MSRMHKCSDGVMRWGPWGAAGLLLRHLDDSMVRRYLLAKRSLNVLQGGTWAFPGGAIDRGETPIQAALREAREELGYIGQYRIHTVIEDRLAEDWSYTTVIADVDEMFSLTDFNWETTEMSWFTPYQVSLLNLHPGVAKAWPTLVSVR